MTYPTVYSGSIGRRVEDYPPFSLFTWILVSPKRENPLGFARRTGEEAGEVRGVSCFPEASGEAVRRTDATPVRKPDWTTTDALRTRWIRRTCRTSGRICYQTAGRTSGRTASPNPSGWTLNPPGRSVRRQWASRSDGIQRRALGSRGSEGLTVPETVPESREWRGVEVQEAAMRSLGSWRMHRGMRTSPIRRRRTNPSESR